MKNNDRLQALRSRIQSHHAEVIKAAERIDRILRSDPADSGTELMGRLFEAIEGGELSLVFAGKYSSGKSTLLNGLIGGKEVLPTSPDATTATVVELRRTRERRGQVLFAEMRTVGPFREYNDATEKHVLDSIVRCARLRGRPVLAVEALQSEKGSGEPVAIHGLEVRLAHLRTGPEVQKTPGKYPFLRLRLRKARPRNFDLRNPKDADKLYAWIKDSPRALRISRVKLEVAPRGRWPQEDVVLMDTPGIDSLSLEHRLATQRAIGEATAVGLCIDAKELSLSGSDRDSLRAITRWCEGELPANFFFLATQGDLAVENYQEEMGQGATRVEAATGIRAKLTLRLNEFLCALADEEGAGIYGAAELVSASDVFVLDGTRLSDPDLDGAKLRQRLDEALAGQRGAVSMRLQVRKLRHRITNLEATIGSHIKDVAASLEARNDEKSIERKVQGLDKVIQSLPKRREAVRGEQLKSVDEAEKRIKRWIKDAFTTRKAVEELIPKWRTQLNGLLESLNKGQKSLVSEINVELEAILGKQEAPLEVVDIEEKKIFLLDGEKVGRPFKGILANLKRVLGWFLPIGSERGQAREACEKAEEEVRRAAESLRKDVHGRSDSLARSIGRSLSKLKSQQENFERLLKQIANQRGKQEAMLQGLSDARGALGPARRELSVVVEELEQFMAESGWRSTQSDSR